MTETTVRDFLYTPDDGDIVTLIHCTTCRRDGQPLTLHAEVWEDWRESRDDGYDDWECNNCMAAEAEWEAQSLSAAESGAGQELVYDAWADRVYGG